MSTKKKKGHSKSNQSAHGPNQDNSGTYTAYQKQSPVITNAMAYLHP